MSDSEAVLVKWTLVLQKDGKIRSSVANIDPEEFLKAANAVSQDWEDGPVIAKIINYTLHELKNFDDELDKYLITL